MNVQGWKLKFVALIFALASTLEATPALAAGAQAPHLQSTAWTHLSTAQGDLETPTQSKEQTASLILDINKDGKQDFVIGARKTPGPSLVWYERRSTGWRKYLIESAVLDIEAGGAYHDIDGDGDLDIVMGGSTRSNQVWWWENPFPNYAINTGWTRREIKNSGANKHHDQLFGDFDHDGRVELVFWNQHASKLFLAEIPNNPRNAGAWSYTEIYGWSGGMEHEGLAQADVNGDGKLDLVGGGRWFNHTGGANFAVEVIDDELRFSRVAVGQLVAGGRPEIVFGAGDWTGPLRWYQWSGGSWQRHNLISGNIDHGHSLEVADVNGDGHLDIFTAEMRLDGGNNDAKTWLFLGDSNGNFTRTEVASGFDLHEARLGDLDADGDLDILGKPYNHRTPRIDIWLNNQRQAACKPALNQWRRHVIDSAKPARSIFITHADLDGDGWQDVVTGGWWYKNPGSPNGNWARKTIGSPFNNLAEVYDFDQDGDIDLLGWTGQGSRNHGALVWANNNGRGGFSIGQNIGSGSGDFLQGVAVERFQNSGPIEVALSWHNGGNGIQMLTVPANPANGQWSWRLLSSTTQAEALSVGDIDDNGQNDLLLGTQWLRNRNNNWDVQTLHNTGAPPDRNRLVDMNGDGRLDAVVGYEAINQAGVVAWYEQPATATNRWPERVIANVIGPMSLDVSDLDRDGDPDVAVGEHNMAQPNNARLFVFENTDGRGGAWQQHIVHTGDEHHDGAQIVDIDADGDDDIISIGWDHSRVLLYENTASACGDEPPPSPCEPSSSNVILNPSFETGKTYWKISSTGTAAFATTGPAQHCASAAKVALSRPGTNSQLFQTGVTLQPNTSYRLRFAAYSSGGRDLSLFLQKHTSPSTNYGLKKMQVDLSTGWRTYSISFTTPNFGGSVNDGRLRFSFTPFAATGDVYWVDSVELTQANSSQADDLATPGEIVLLENDSPDALLLNEPTVGAAALEATLLVSPEAAFAEGAPGNVQGMVQLLAGEAAAATLTPVAGVTVSLLDAATNGATFAQQTQSDGNGRYLFSSVPAGDYLLLITPPPNMLSGAPLFVSTAGEAIQVVQTLEQPVGSLYLPLVARN